MAACERPVGSFQDVGQGMSHQCGAADCSVRSCNGPATVNMRKGKGGSQASSHQDSRDSSCTMSPRTATATTSDNNPEAGWESRDRKTTRSDNTHRPNNRNNTAGAHRGCGATPVPE